MTRDGTRVRLCATISAIAVGTFSTIAAEAQTSTAAAARTGSETQRRSEALDTDIVVTATRRADRLQEVPIAVTAVGESDIKKLNYDRFEDYARSVPGLTLNQGEKNRANFVIRGVSTNSGINATQDPVAVYIDDMLVSDAYAASVTPDLRLFDINRVEVLRGPQGTLFGSGTLSGVVRVITNQPDVSAIEAAGRVGLAMTGDDLGFNVDAMVNVPLADGKVAVRAVGYYRDVPGYTHNRTLHLKDSNRETAAGGRVAVKWQINDNLSLTTTALYQDSSPKDGSYAVPTLGPYERTTLVPETRGGDLQFYTASLNYEAGFADITSVTSYILKDGNYTSDFTQLIGIAPYVLVATDKSKTFSQELRIASKPGGKLDWLVGGYYADRSRDLGLSLVSPGLTATAASRGLTNVTSDTLAYRPIDASSYELAAFADGTFRLSDQWSVFGGVRFSYYSQSFNRVSTDTNVLTALTLIARGLLTRPVPITTTHLTESGGSSGSATTGRFGVRWTPNKDLQVFASASRGFRIGQFNTGYGPDPIDPVNGFSVPEGYAPDALWNFELGVKSSLLDRRLILNTSLFYIDWDNLQISANRPSDRRVFISNVGEARIKGIELEARALPVPQLELGVSGSVQDAKISKVSPRETILTGARRGDRLPSAAKFQGSAYAEYHNQIGTGEGYARFTVQHVGKSLNGYSLAPITGVANPQLRTQPSYEVVNLNVGIRWDHAEIAMFATNLFNSSAIVQIDPARTTTTGVASNNTLYLAPRTVGVSLTLRQ